MITTKNRGRKIFIVKEDSIDNIDYAPYFYTKDDKGEFTTIFGDKCSKIFVKNPSDIVKEKENHEKTYEADVLHSNRFLIDFYDDIPMPKFRKCYIDIEIEVTGDFPNVIEAPNKILSISLYDTSISKYITFILGKEDKKDGDIYWCTTEAKLLKGFANYVKKCNPHIFIAWNGAGFDYPYILQRMKKLELNINELSPLDNSFVNESKYGIRTEIEGRILFDLMEAYKFISQGNRESYSLEYISQYELGEGKEKYSGDLGGLYDKDIQKFIRYNLRDVELLKLLDSKLKMVEFIDTLRRYSRCNWYDVYSSAKLIDSIFLKEAKGRFILPNNKWENSERIKGAFVVSPKPGLYKDIAVFDWKSLYPNIIRTFNLSPERIIKHKEDDCITVKNDMISTIYISKEIGFIPQVVEKVLNERVIYKKKMKEYNIASQEYRAYDMLQYAVKVIANSIYGVLKDKCRLSDSRIAEAVTTMGQTIIKKAQEITEKNGCKVIYGDTDSIFLAVDGLTEEQINNLSKKITLEIREWCKSEFGCPAPTLELGFEKIFSKVFFVGDEEEEKAAKKRYAGHIKWLDGSFVDKIQITGFEAVRSDSPQVIRQFQKDLFDMVLRDKAKEEVDTFIKDFKTRFYQMKEEIGIPCGVNKELEKNRKSIPIHFRAAMLSNDRHHTNFGIGSKIKYIYVKEQPMGYGNFENVIGFKDKLWDGYKIDYDKMYERLVEKKVELIYNVMGWKPKQQSRGVFDFV